MKRMVLITGASSGIGMELARCVAADGSNVALLARRDERLQTLADELRERYDVQVRVLVQDLEDPNTPDAVAQELADVEIDILVNNAGFGARGRFTEIDLDEQMAMLRVNVDALTHLTGLFLPGMIRRGRGGVLNLGSTAGFQPGPYMAVYYATKAYVLSFSEGLAEETRGTGVTITCLAPGPTRTEFQATAGTARAWVSQINPATATDVAKVGWSGFKKGKTIVVPGMMNSIAASLAQISPRIAARKMAGLLNYRQLPES